MRIWVSISVLALIILISIFLFQVNFQKYSHEKAEKTWNRRIREHSVIKETERKAFSADLQEKIQNFIAKDDSFALARSSFQSKPVILVNFSQIDSNCLVLISHAHFYTKEGLLGYVIQTDRMIAVYSDDKKCTVGMVETEVLNTDPPSQFMSIDEIPDPPPPFNPRYREYKIGSNNELVLIDKDGRF